MTIDERLNELRISLIDTPIPLGSYLPYVRSGNLIFISGVLPLRNGKLSKTGKLGEAISLDEAREDARQVVVNAISILKSATGNLEKISKCIKINGYIASTAEFTEHSKVLNSASDLLVEVFGEAGRHARAAIGVCSLPLNSPIEIDFIFEVRS